MQVIGFNFDKIAAERKSYEIRNNLKINSNLNVKDITEEKTDVLKDRGVLKFVFEFITSYEENYASLVFSGSILIASEKAKIKDVLKSWKNKEVDPSLRVMIFNFILNKCNLRSLQLEDELGLPLHIQLPRISEEKPESKYTG